MRAIQARSYGGVEVLAAVELPVPAPGPGEVRVRVAATSVNPVDWKSRQGYIADWYADPPYVWGWDVSGTVDAVGIGVAGFSVGDEVFGMPRFPGLAGAYAEWVTAPAYQLARKPATIGHPEAAALPLAGLTAFQVLDLAGVGAGQRLLVNAAAGGVGHLAVQLAAARGAHVIGAASVANHDFVRSLGAEPVSYADAAKLADLDAVVDAFGAPELLATVRPGGAFAAVAGSAELAEAAAGRDLRYISHLVHPDGPRLAAIADLVDSGRVRPEVSAVYPLDRIGEAHDHVAAGHTRGKVVVTI